MNKPELELEVKTVRMECICKQCGTDFFTYGLSTWNKPEFCDDICKAKHSKSITAIPIEKRIQLLMEVLEKLTVGKTASEFSEGKREGFRIVLDNIRTQFPEIKSRQSLTGEKS